MPAPVFDWAMVTAIAPELATPTVSIAGQAAFISFANAQVSDCGWGADANMGRTYLAAHLATLSLRRGNGQVTAEAVGALSRQYGLAKSLNPSLSLTAYGMEYERLSRLQVSVLGYVP